jgi:hypothetical protein
VKQSDLLRMDLTLSDQSQAGPLQNFLRQAVPNVGVSLIAGQPKIGEQGVLDMIAVLASSSGLVATIKVLPEFLRSRRTALSITTTVKGQPFVVTVTNVDEVLPVLERILDA